MLKHYLNEAKLKLKDEAYEDALDASSKALDLDGMNFQALMVKGKCLTHRTVGPFHSVDFILDNIVRLVPSLSWADEDIQQDEDAAKNMPWAPPSAAASLRSDVAAAIDIAVDNAWRKVKQAPCDAKPAARQALDALAAHLTRACPRAKRAAEVRLLRIEDNDSEVLSPAEEEQCLAVLKSTASSTTSPLVHLYRGLDQANAGQFPEVVDSSVASIPEHIQARVVVAMLSLESATFDPQRCLDMIRAAQDAVQCRFDTLGTSPRSYSDTAMNLLQARALIAQHNWVNAIMVYEGIIEHEPFLPDAVIGLAEVHLHQGNLDDAASTMQFLPPQESAAYCAAKGWLAYHQGDLAAAHATLEAGLAYPDVTWALKYRLARVYWDLGGDFQTNKAFCVAQLVGAAKLNPHEAVIFRWLGTYYLDVAADPVRAEKCFLKALSLDPSCQVCGLALTDSLYATNYERAVQLWTDMAATPVHAPWALLRLAQHDVTHGNETAIAHLHKLLRHDPHNASLWAALGHVYQVFGRIVAAQKSYAKSLSLVGSYPDDATNLPSTSVLCELARIELSLGLLDEALAHLTTAVEAGVTTTSNGQTNVGAAVHKLLAETLFTQAKMLCAQGLYGRSHDKLKQASTVLCTYLSQTSQTDDDDNDATTSLYKLVGDIHLFAFYLPVDDTWLSFLQQGTDAYLKALSAQPHDAMALFDVGVGYWVQAQARAYLQNVPMAKWSLQHQPAYPPEILSPVTTARSYLTQSLQANPNDANVWNALGAVHDHIVLKQFAFVRAIELENLDAAWANLGMLYLQSGHLGNEFTISSYLTVLDIALAQKAFLSLQGVNPNHPAMWLGNGLMECQNQDPAQAHAAFTCAMELRLDLDILHGFAYTALLSRTGSLDQALFALKKYNERDARHPAAINSLGVALMRTGLFQQAVAAFQSALELVKNDVLFVAGGTRNLVQALIHVNQFDLADTALHALDKSSPQVSLLKATVLVGRGGHDKEALAALDQAVKDLPASLTDDGVVHVHLTRSVLLHQLGHVDSSRESLQALLLTHPGKSDAILTVMLTLGGASMWWSPSEATMTQALCGPLVALYQKLNLGAECKRICDFWTTTFPKDPNGWLALAQSSLHFGKLVGPLSCSPTSSVPSSVLPYDATLLRYQIESVEQLFGSWHASDAAVRKWLHLHPVDSLAPLLVAMALLKRLAIAPTDESLLHQAKTWLESYASNATSSTPYTTWLWHVLNSYLYADMDNAKATFHAVAATTLVTTDLSAHVPVLLYQARSVVYTDPDAAIALYLAYLKQEKGAKAVKVELAVLLEAQGYIKSAWRLWKDVDDGETNEWKGLVAVKRAFLHRENPKLAAKCLRDLGPFNVSDTFVQAFKAEFDLA
ncbi:hypothetical protein DYB37_004211 [Aphanomyces astaci]|uniref:TPR-like protein n=1 Tax=Aphanomyces astaci TaxID=112090 RepID=A0A3R6Y865_APHAT|nr:hypothetical protein DYB37_004211 [Aphanomyces astaci]